MTEPIDCIGLLFLCGVILFTGDIGYKIGRWNERRKIQKNNKT